MNTTSMVAHIAKIQRMTTDQLRDEWLRVFGEPTRSRNRPYLLRRIAWQLQARVHGGLSERAKQRLVDLGDPEFVRVRVPAAPTLAHDAPSPPARKERPTRDPRLPTPGTIITRQYHGRELRLVVLDDGFELEGVRYGSLSEAARAVTGAHWNGKLFWGLAQRKRKS